MLDEYSRFLIVHIMRTTTADRVIDKLENTFTIFDYPKMCKTDNGPPFDSFAFDEYMKAKAIKHHRITPEHPQSNAKSERFMRVLGKTLRTADIEEKDWKKELENLFLITATHQIQQLDTAHRTYSLTDLFEQVFQKSVSPCSIISIRNLVRMKRLTNKK